MRGKKVKIGKDNYRHKRKIKSVKFPKTPKQERVSREASLLR